MRIFRFFALSLGLAGFAMPSFAQQDPAPAKPQLEQPIKEPPPPKPERPEPIPSVDKLPNARPQVDGGDIKPAKAPTPKPNPTKVNPNQPGAPNLKPVNAEKPNPDDTGKTKLGSDPRPSNSRPTNLRKPNLKPVNAEKPNPENTQVKAPPARATTVNPSKVKKPNLKPVNAEKPNPDSVKPNDLRPSQNRPGAPGTLQPNQPNKPQANDSSNRTPTLEAPQNGPVRGVKAELSKPQNSNQLKPTGKVQVQPQLDSDKAQKAPVPQRKLERLPAPTPGH